MTSIPAKVIESFPKAFRTILFCKFEAIGFGDERFDDVVVVKRLKTPVSTAIAFSEGKVCKPQSSAIALYKRYRSLLDKGSVGSFSLSKTTFSLLKRAKTKLDATHVHFHSDNDGVHLAVFDIRRFVPQARLKRKHEPMLVIDTVSAQDRYRFSVTLSADSICLLPTAECLVTVDPYGLVKFVYGDDNSYLVRDQKLIPPITTFFSDPLETDIALWLHPTTR